MRTGRWRLRGWRKIQLSAGGLFLLSLRDLPDSSDLVKI